MSNYGPIALMDLYIETLTGVLMELMVHPYETIYSIKAKIHKLEGFPISEQHLIWQAIELDNEMSLHHYRIPDGATLRLVLNMRGGPINMRRVPVEDSSLREMAEYFSDSLGDDHTTGDRPVTVIVYQQGEHINFFRLVDRDASSSLSYSLSGGSDFNGEDESPMPRERQEENERTRNKMKMIKEQMENLSLLKEKKQQSIRHGRVPRPPSSGRPLSRSRMRLTSGATIKQPKLNRNTRLPPVGHPVLLLPPVQGSVENSATVGNEVSGSALKGSDVALISSLPSVLPKEPKPSGLPLVSRVDSDSAQSVVAISRITGDSETAQSRNISSLASNGANQSVDVVNAVESLPSNQPGHLPDNPIDRVSHRKAKNENPVIELGGASDANRLKESPGNSVALSSDCKNTISNTNTPQKVSNVTSSGEPSPVASNLCRRDSTKTSHGNSAEFSHPTFQSVQSANVPASGGRLLQQRSPLETARVGHGDSNPAEAVLGYLMSPKHRGGGEKRPGAVTLQSLNHQEARAVSGMLRNIVRSANRSQAGYVVSSGKLMQVPLSPVPPPAQAPFSDPTKILRVLSGSREGRTTPVRVRLPSVKLTRKKSVKRCALCKKRTKLSTGFQCRCGENFCLTHLCAEAHGCTYDYKAEGRKLIEQSNPVVTAPKLPKI